MGSPTTLYIIFLTKNLTLQSLPWDFNKHNFLIADTCESNEFTCSNTDYRPESVVCDGNDDCGDNRVTRKTALVCITTFSL